jgi:mannose-6-phosphate isomerase
VAESLKSIKWDDFEPVPVRGSKTEALIADAREFGIRRVPVAAGKSLSITKNQQPRILSVVQGRFHVGNEVFLRGDNVVLPFAGEFVLEAADEAVLLLTENFC